MIPTHVSGLIGALIAVLITIVGLALSFWKIFGGTRKERNLAEWARLNGLSFVPEKDPSFGLRFSPITCLQRGADCYAFNVMEGTVGKWPVRAFDYHYATDDDQDCLLSAVIVDAGFPLKPLSIRPESFLDKAAGYAGSEDIDLESAEFNRRFCVKSPDRRWAHDVLQPKTMELMLSYSRFDIDLQGSHVIAYWHDRTFSCGDFGCALKVVTGILNNLPEYVFEELRAMHS